MLVHLEPPKKFFYLKKSVTYQYQSTEAISNTTGQFKIAKKYLNTEEIVVLFSQVY
jgi:hypothetical protein